MFIMAVQTQIHLRTASGAIAALALTLTGCNQPTQTVQPQPTGSEEAVSAPELDAVAPTSSGIKVDGSSTVYPISKAVADEFRLTKEGKKAETDVQFSGSSAGFKKFCAAETDISNASRPILVREVKACNKAGVRFIELPVAFDALTIAVNPKNTWATDITMAELKTIWDASAEGKITNWKQVRDGYPDRPLALFGAGKDSGTFDYFNEVTTNNPSNSRQDYTASEDDNELVTGIAKDPNALGYIPFAYYETNQNHLKALAIDSGKGPVLPSRETVEKAQYQPFSRPLFIYVNAKSAQTKPEVRAFVEFYLKNARRISKTVGYVPLPDEAYHLANVQFQKGEIGKFSLE